MVRIVTGSLVGIESPVSGPDASSVAFAEQLSQDKSPELMQLVHVASVLLRQGEIALAQQVLDQACALGPVHAQRRDALRCSVAGTTIAGAPPALSTSVAERRSSSTPPRRDTRICPVRVRALGGFEVMIDGIAFSSGIKPQRRPLDLLKLLVLADAAPIGAGELADKMWPDSDGDTARNCLQVAVHRLRRLLGHEQAVLVHDRKLHLNRTLCSVDLWEFEAEVAQLIDMPLGGGDFAGRAARALGLYRGHLFSHEPDQAWMLAPRERLRRTWLDLVRQLGRDREMRGEWDGAYRLYQSAIELDPFAEEIYRRLMLCQHTMGQRNEALYTYRRCRKQLAAVLGVEPSAETERLHRVLSNAAS
jgi:LuxR family transcriptional regulator, maltose regulon positive regulatory protein